MNPICDHCKKKIQPGQTAISKVKDGKKLVFHTRCYTAFLFAPKDPKAK